MDSLAILQENVRRLIEYAEEDPEKSRQLHDAVNSCVDRIPVVKTAPSKPSKEDLEKPAPLFPRGVSLQSIEGDQAADRIEFTREFRIQLIDIYNMRVHDSRSPLPMVLYHAHVAWSYALHYAQAKKNCYAFHLTSHGSHFSQKPGKNVIKGLREPDVLEASFAFAGKDGNEKQRFVLDTAPGPQRLAVAKTFKRPELAKFADDGMIYIRVRFVIARSYFSLSKLMPKPSVVPKSAEDCVKRILSGVKSNASDWLITIGKGDEGSTGRPARYYVNNTLKDFIGERLGERIQFTGDRSCAIPSIDHDDMIVILAVVYGASVSFPDDLKRAAKLALKMRRFHQNEVMKEVIYPSWELSICNKALAVDKDDINSVAVANDLLMIIWSAPYGAMPVAKRVAMGVFSDLLYVRIPYGPAKGTEIGNFLENLPKNEYTDAIRASTSLYQTQAFTVRKVGLASSKERTEPCAATEKSTFASGDQAKPSDEIPPTGQPSTSSSNNDKKPGVTVFVTSPDLPAPVQIDYATACARILEEILEDAKSEPEDAKSEPEDAMPAPEDAKPQTEDAKPEPEVAKSEPEDVVPEPEDAKPEPEDTKLEPGDPKSEPEDAKPEPEDAKPEPEDAKPEPEDAKPEPENTKEVPESADSEEEEWVDEAMDNFNPRDVKCKCVVS